MEYLYKNPSTCPPWNDYLGLLSDSVHEMNGSWSKIHPLVHIKIIISFQRPNSSMRWTIHGRKIDLFVHLKKIIVVHRPILSMRWTVWAQMFVRCSHGGFADSRLRPWRPGQGSMSENWSFSNKNWNSKRIKTYPRARCILETYNGNIVVWKHYLSLET